MEKGFTLTEILVYIAVLSIIVLALSSFFLWASRFNVKTKITREVFDNMRRTMEALTSEIRGADGIYTATSLFATSSGQLSLETKKYLPDGETSSYVDFYLCEDRLCFKKEGQIPTALTSENVEITNLEFSQILTTSTVPSIQIKVRVDYKSSVAKPEYQAFSESTSTVSLRNY